MYATLGILAHQDHLPQLLLCSPYFAPIMSQQSHLIFSFLLFSLAILVFSDAGMGPLLRVWRASQPQAQHRNDKIRALLHCLPAEKQRKTDATGDE